MSRADSEARALAEHGAVFGEYRNYAPPEYEDHTNEALYVEMSEGHRIAIDVTLPAPLSPDARIPAILYTTRYWRAKKDYPVDELDLFFASHGYAFVRADERGTGASFGTWPNMWPRAAIADYKETVDWIVAQPWSDGTVGSTGVSYTGTTAQLLAVTNHPAVKAVVPKFIEFDVYTDIIYPGGLLLESLMKGYIERCRLLDLNRWTNDSVKPVDADIDGSVLAEAVKEHRATNPDFSKSMDVTHRDDRIPGLGVTIDDFSMHELREEIERSGVAIYGWGSWNDACTADTVIRRFMTFSNPQRAVIGAWNHGGDKNANQYLPDYSPTQPSHLAQRLEDLRFFDHHLKGVETGVMDEPVVTYVTMGITMGDQAWKRTSTWPVEGTVSQRWHMSEGGVLRPERPPSADGSDSYTVDFVATTGSEGRWHTEFQGTDVVYGDRAEADRRLLTYTSEPLEADMEVTGYPVVTLYVTSSHADGAFLVYLEDVSPDGRVRYVTGGELRALHRKVSEDEPPYRMLMPHHTYRRADAMPLVPGQVSELVIGLQPTSVLFRKGHRVRIAIAGHDEGVFTRVPPVTDETVAFEVQRNATDASWVELPVVASR
ncbi:MAG: CocE/NonD family hydrolase [Chloroflexi bacterium]|nr:CocE/NonD family hydrolase [Chloroflexota bacterium]